MGFLADELSLDDWAKLLGSWASDYRPPNHLTPEFLFSHLHEEVSEAWRCWRDNDFKMHRDFEMTTGLDKPEGLPAELADCLAMCLILMERFGITPTEALAQKTEYLFAKLEQKNNRRMERL